MSAPATGVPRKRFSLEQLLQARSERYIQYDLADLYQRIGLTLGRRHPGGAARAMLALAAYKFEKHFGTGHLATQEALNLLALHDFNAADYASALTSYRSLYQRALEAWGPSDRLTRIARIRVWQCLRRL